MKIKLVLLAVLVAALGISANADARKLTDKDKAVAKKFASHLGAMGDILDKHAKDTKKALEKMSKELDKDEQKKKKSAK